MGDSLSYQTLFHDLSSISLYLSRPSLSHKRCSIDLLVFCMNITQNTYLRAICIGLQ